MCNKYSDPIILSEYLIKLYGVRKPETSFRQKRLLLTTDTEQNFEHFRKVNFKIRVRPGAFYQTVQTSA